MWPDPLQKVVSNWITGPQAVGWQKASSPALSKHISHSAATSRSGGLIWVMVGTFTATTPCWKGRRGILDTDQYGCRQLCAACAASPSLGQLTRQLLPPPGGPHFDMQTACQLWDLHSEVNEVFKGKSGIKSHKLTRRWCSNL